MKSKRNSATMLKSIANELDNEFNGRKAIDLDDEDLYDEVATASTNPDFVSAFSLFNMRRLDGIQSQELETSGHRISIMYSHKEETHGHERKIFG